MARDQRRRRRSRTAPPTQASSPPPAPLGIPRTNDDLRPDWRWRTFPVFFAFVSGLLLAFFVNEGTQNVVAAVVLIGALLGFGYGLAHMVVMNVVVANRVRRRRAAIASGEAVVSDAEDPSGYEDVLVYDDGKGSERG